VGVVRRGALILVLAGWLAACGNDGGGETPTTTTGERAMTLTSEAFSDGEEIPVRHGGCPPGENVSPPLAWSGVPAAAEALALVVVDPDAGDFLHWGVFDLDPGLTGLTEGEVPDGAVEARNDAGTTGYFGPCPPETHTYVFTLYAVSGPTETPEEAEDQAIATASLRGTYTPPPS
jgi:Raf kinase inhibitor-like YbhB/YbcL family protein